MTGEQSTPARVVELATVARNLYDALVEARPYVVEEARLENAGLGPILGNSARETLDKLDAAIADAGEYLAGVSS